MVISNFLLLPSVFAVSRLDSFYTISIQRILYVSRLFLVSLVLWIDKPWGNTLREKLHDPCACGIQIRALRSVNRSIAKGYVTEEVIEFCVDYVEELLPIGIPVSRHEGWLIGKGTLGRKSVNTTDHATLSKVHLTVLQQSVLVAPYMEEHMQIVRSIYSLKSETWITKHHNDTFATWLQKEVIGQ